MPPRTPTARQTAADPSGEPAGDYVEFTRQFWQPYAKRPLSREDARQMAHNLVGFFSLLREWKRAETEQQRLGIVAEAPTPPRKRGRPRKHAAPADKSRG